MAVILPTWSIDEDIYKGFWINNSFGTIRGATLTIDRQAGGLIIAFLALFIAATTRSFWKIVRFLAHTAGSVSSKQNGIYHQKQAILRNQSLARDAVVDLVRLIYVWRDRAIGVKRQMTLLTFVALAVSIASVASGLLSSRILTNSTSEALIRGRDCDTATSYPDFSASSVESFMHYQSQKSVEALTYATQCYLKNRTLRAQVCETFSTPALPYSVDRNTSCPFASEICKAYHGNIFLDSGTIDSLIHLGLNRAPFFTLRQWTQCAPLETTGFTSIINDPNTNRSKQVYHYGSKTVRGVNKTYVYETEVGKDRPDFDGDASGNYKVTAILMSTFGMGGRPIPQLRHSNAVISLLFLDASEILYANPTDDPWFAATTTFSDASPVYETNGSRPFFPDQPVGVVGCVTRRSYCNAKSSNSARCIDPFISSSNEDSLQALSAAWPIAEEQSAMLGFMSALSNAGSAFPELYYTMPSAPTLLSRSTIVSNLQSASLPKTRWQDEREHLFKAGLAAMQSTMVEHARGFSSSQNLYCNAGLTCRRLCHSQKVRSSTYYSFSAFTLCAILVFGSVTMLISAFVEEIFAFAIRHPRLRRAKLIYSLAEWQAGSTLQLQRLAHENLGLGTWTRTDEAVPVTEPGDALGTLNITNTKHARLVAPSEELTAVDPAGALPGNVKPSLRYSRLPSTDNL